MRNNRTIRVFALLLSLVLSLLVGAVIFAVCGYSPASVYVAIFKGGLGSFSAIISSLSQTMTIAFMGLAYIVAIRAGICNIGLEGQMYAGAIVSAIVGVSVTGIPAVIHLPLVMLAAVTAAGIYGALIAVLKLKFGANEIITAIMLNFIMENFTAYLVSGPLKMEGTVAQTEQVQPTARLVNLIDIPQLSSGIIIFVLLTFLLFWVLKYTRFGYEIRVTGENTFAAETGGICASAKMTTAMFLSGAVAGLAGAIIVTGVNGRFVEGFSSGYGWDGIAVASLAGMSIIGNMFSALLFGVLKAGAMVVNRTAGIPYDFIVVIQAFIVLMLGCPRLSAELLEKIKKIAGRKKQ